MTHLLRLTVEGEPVAKGPKMTERQLSDAIVQLARLCRWRIHRDPYWRPTATDAGWPDLVLMRPRSEPWGDTQVIIAELKVNGRKTTAEQDAWLALWRDVPGASVYVWRDTDWTSGRIEECLR